MAALARASTHPTVVDPGGAAATAAAAHAAAAHAVLHHPGTTSGSTREGQARPLPGDDLIVLRGLDQRVSA